MKPPTIDNNQPDLLVEFTLGYIIVLDGLAAYIESAPIAGDGIALPTLELIVQ